MSSTHRLIAEIDQAQQTITTAKQEVFAICAGKHWRMCIPVQPDDSDVVIMNALSDATRLLRECRAALIARDGIWASYPAPYRDEGADVQPKDVERQGAS